MDINLDWVSDMVDNRQKFFVKDTLKLKQHLTRGNIYSGSDLFSSLYTEEAIRGLMILSKIEKNLFLYYNIQDRGHNLLSEIKHSFVTQVCLSS
jgi:hypothetical protein